MSGQVVWFALFEPWGLLVRVGGTGVGMLSRAVVGEPAPDGDGDGRVFVEVREPAGTTIGLWSTAVERVTGIEPA